MGVVLLLAIAAVFGWIALRPFPASYESRCSLCGNTIYEGDEIVGLDGEWVHAHCAEDDGEEVAW